MTLPYIIPADAEIKEPCGGNPGFPHSKPRVGQNIALHAVPVERTSSLCALSFFFFMGTWCCRKAFHYY